MAFQFIRSHYFLTPVLLCVVLIVLHGVYNRYFHPLSKVPGPFMASVTDFYKLYIYASKHIPSTETELHRKYGPIVRVAPNLVSFNDPEMIPAIYHSHADKTPFYTPAVMGEVTSMFWSLKASEHVWKRRVFSPALGMKSLRQHEGVVDERILKLCDALRQRFAKSSEMFEFSTYIRWFLNDTIAQLTFGESTGFVEQGHDVKGLVQALHDMSLMTGLVAALPWLVEPLVKNSFLKPYLLPRPGNASGSGKIMTHRDELIKKRLHNHNSGSPHDFLDSLLHTKALDGNSLHMSDVKAECLSYMIAASDTTAGLICPLVGSIIKEPRVYKTLVSEIDDFTRKGKVSSRVASFDETNEMPYFTACVRETLRLFPSTPIVLPRYVSEGGVNLDGVYLPEGTEIGANPWLINRNEAIFGQDANVFRPERWLEDVHQTKQMEKYLFTFGYGARECIGKNLARLEAQKLCLQIFRDFEIESASPGKPWICKDRGLSIYEDQWIILRERRRVFTDSTAATP